MAATGSVRIVKEFNYRGGVRHFSNRYAIGTNSPPDPAHWTTLCDAITAAEKLVYVPYAAAGARILQAIGYDAGSEIPVFSKTYALDGTLATTFSKTVPGDVAALVRYSTPDRSSKNHPVYCFNYYHGVVARSQDTTCDKPSDLQVTALQTYAAAWLTGFSDGVTTYHRSRPTGDLCTGYTVATYLTHRDLTH
jgi:hypothetical protein